MFGKYCFNIINIYPKCGFSMYSRLFISNIAKTLDNLKPAVEQFNEEVLGVSEINLEEIERKCNKSRLAIPHRNMLNGRVPYNEPVFEHHSTIKYMKKLYGLYGAASGVDPRVCWPTMYDLSVKKEYEKISQPRSIQEMIATSLEKKKRQREIIVERENEIAMKLAKLNQWKKELEEKINKKEAEALAAKAKRDRLIEEVRRYFGFKIDPRDERFKEMLEKKEKEEKKLAKETRKKAREAKLLAQITNPENVEVLKPS